MQKNSMKRDTARNLIFLLKNGHFSELPKIIRRRFLNSIKYISRFLRKFIGLVIDYPPIKYRREQKRLNRVLMKYFDYSIKGLFRDNKLQIALIIREGKTAPKSSAFIRLIAPLTNETIKDRVSFKIFEENTTLLDRKYNFCIVQRTAFDTVDKAEELIQNLKKANIALIVDTDDAFDAISIDHPEFNTKSPRTAAMNALLNNASQIWVSTSILQKSLDHKLQKKAFVVPNGLDPRLWQTKVNNNKKVITKKLRMVYMGTATHDKDLKIILPALEKLNGRYPGSFSLDLVGVTDNAPSQAWVNRIYLKSSLYPEFVEWFVSKNRFDIGLSPLVDSDFNKGKSDIKCLDYLAAGILPVVSNTEAYKATGLDSYVIRVNNASDAWLETLESLITKKVSEAEVEKRVKNGQQYVWDKRSSKNTATIIYQHLVNDKKSN